MSISRTAFGLAVLLFVAVSPTTTAHEQYSPVGDLLHWYAHAAQAHPSVVRYAELREPGYDHAMVPLATFTNYAAGQAPGGHNKSSVMLVFGEHAREIITCEVGLWFSRVLLGDTAEIASWAEWPEAFKPLGIPADKIQSTVQGWVRKILDHLVVKVLPVENVDGRQAWEAGNLCLRKTSKGVDLNRNYPFAFAAEPPYSDMYGGPHPFSEAQSRLIARLALEGGTVPKAYINVHSGEWAVYSGWDSKAAVGPGLPADLSDLLIRSGDVCRCMAGPAGAVSNYLAYGTGMDFMYTQLGVPYAMTYEVYGRAGPFDGVEPGRIPEGTRNKPLSDYPYVVDEGIAKSLPRLDDLLPPHHQHQRAHPNQHQRTRANAANRLRRSAVDAAGEEGGARYGTGVGGGPGVGDGRRRRSRAGMGRNLLEASADDLATVASSSSSHAVAATELASSSASSAIGGPLGGRSLRRLAATASAETGGSEELAAAAAAEGSGSEGAAVAMLGAAAGRSLLADLASISGPDGPVLAMVRTQPGMQQSCFDMFNPPPGPAYRDVVARWVVILLMTLEHVADPAHPLPSPHPLPGTVLAGAGTAGSGSSSVGASAGGFGAAFGAANFGRRRLMGTSESASAEVAMSGETEAGIAGRSRAEVQPGGNVSGGTAELAAAVGGVEPQASATAAGGGNLYGSADFDRRVQQAAYEVDPVMRQHSLVVFVAICALGVVFVPWFMCAAKTVSRPVPLASRRSWQQQQQYQHFPLQQHQQPPLARAYI